MDVSYLVSKCKFYYVLYITLAINVVRAVFIKLQYRYHKKLLLNNHLLCGFGFFFFLVWFDFVFLREHTVGGADREARKNTKETPRPAQRPTWGSIL